MLKTVIRKSNTIPSAQNHNMPIGAYTKRYNGYLDYKALATEIIELGGK